MTNNKFIAILMLFMSMAFIANAASITLEQAQQQAAQFVLNKQISNRNLKPVALSNSMLKAGNQAAFYIFNVGNNQGFVIVSGDDRINPILGYSDEGNFDEAKAPSNMKNLLSEYAHQISMLDEVAGIDGAIAAARNVIDTRNSIAPLLTTKWDQARPYWNKCPQVKNEDGEYEPSYTGCVATAMSQIMKYYNHPAQTTQVIPSYQYGYGTGNMGEYITQTTEDLPVTTFDWAHMIDSYNGSEDEVYTDAVATLMLYVGHAAHMTYALTASGTTDPYIPKAFTNYFDYNAQLVYRSDYDQQAWEDMVYQELLAGRPMVYNGRAGSGGGHSFVCDGYEMGDYYHINWGWGGLGNGYFQLAIMNPHAAGIGDSTSAEGYNIDQTAIIGITPGYTGQGDDVNHVLTVFNMYYSGNRELERGSNGFSLHKRRQVVVTAEDHIDDGTKYARGIALYDSNNNFVEMIASMTYYSSAISVTDKWPDSNSSTYYYFGKNISNGTYKIVPVCQVQGTSEWIPMLESDRYYIEMNVSGNTATLVDHPLNDLTSTNFEFTGDHRVGAAEQCHVTVQNNSDDRFSGKLYLYVSNEQIDEYGEYTTVVEAEIPAHGSNVVTFNFTPQNAGTKTAQLSLHDSSMGGNKIPGTGSVTIAAAPAVVPMDLSVVIEATNAVDGVIYDTHARFKVDVTNNADGEFNRYLLAPLFIVEDGSGTMVTYQQTTLRIPAHETVTLYYDFDNLAYGSTYALNIYGRNENEQTVNLVEPGHSVYYQVQRGLVTWDGTSMVGNSGPASGNITIPANALAARLEGLNITSVTPSGNPNTIYFIGENENVPNGLAGLNVVKGNVAQSIALIDGYGYFIPQSFTAQNISYKRTFTKARQNGVAENWSTIVLPFAPATCSASNGLWIERFAQEENGEVKFAEVQNIEANVPYIISIDKAAGLINTPITWSASNALLKAEPIAYTSGDQYLMAGTFVQQSLEDIYNVNAAGSVAQWGNGIVAPFRAYFKEIEALDSHANIQLPGEASASNVEELTLAQLIASGVVNNNYSISNPLTVVYISDDGKTLYAKDDNEFALRNQVPYVPNAKQVANDYIFDDVNSFDQSNWITINLPQAVSSSYFNSKITGVDGTLNNRINPEITVNKVPTITGENPYTPNIMCVANFANENSYFLVPPKPLEYVLIHWAVYKDGYFYMPAKGEHGFNTEGLTGSVKVNTTLLGNYKFENNDAYEFFAIVKALNERVSSPSLLAIEHVNIENSDPSIYYEIYPVEVKGITTGINTIELNRSTNDIYFNLMGQPVVNPTPGIYIRGGRKVIVK
ncbi:MAG: C10 family peptidase [Muribaculaceae bacterium]|nr:C10 family peptidase [Muribaculaceae bacterium]